MLGLVPKKRKSLYSSSNSTNDKYLGDSLNTAEKFCLRCVLAKDGVTPCPKTMSSQCLNPCDMWPCKTEVKKKMHICISAYH